MTGTLLPVEGGRDPEHALRDRDCRPRSDAGSNLARLTDVRGFSITTDRKGVSSYDFLFCGSLHFQNSVSSTESTRNVFVGRLCLCNAADRHAAISS